MRKQRFIICSQKVNSANERTLLPFSRKYDIVYNGVCLRFSYHHRETQRLNRFKKI